MGYLDNIWRAITGKEVTSADVRPTGYETQSYEFGYGDNSKKVREYLQEMQGWVYACVSAIADEIGSIELKLYRTTNDGVEEVKEHEILDSLYKVNNFTTKFDHFWLTTAYLELTGEAPWFLEKTGKKIDAIYFLQPDRLEPIPDKANVIKGYRYDVGNGEKVTLQLDEVIFLKNPNPANPFRGLGTLKASARSVDVDNFSETWNRKFFENSARPDAILTVDTEMMTDEQKKKLKASIRESYGGKEKAHQLMVLFGNMKLDKFSTTQRDMDFLEMSKFNRDKILGLFRVPKAVISQTDGVNFASAHTAQYTFARWTIQPKMERLIQQLNEFYVPLFSGSENLFLDYENPIPTDDAAKLEKYKAAANVWMTVNEIREEEGLEPLGEEGDKLYIPANFTEVGAQPQALPTPQKTAKHIKEDRHRQLRARSKTYFKVKELEAEVKEQIKQGLRDQFIHKRAKQKKRFKQLSEEKKLEFWKIKNQLYQDYQPDVQKAMDKVFADEQERVLAAMDEQKAIRHKKDISVQRLLLDPDVEEELLAKEVLPILEKLFKEAADDTFTFIGVDLEMDIDASSIQELMQADNRRLAKSVTATTNDAIKDAVAAGLAEKESFQQIRERIEQAVFGEAASVRSEMIAKTETIRFNVNATEQAFIDSGVVAAKQWQTDTDPCPQCQALQGKIVDLGKNYYDKGETTATGVEITYADVKGPPLHPNCFCDLVPVFIQS